MITIELVKNFIWIFFVTCWILKFGGIIRHIGEAVDYEKLVKLAVVIQGISAISLLAEGIISLPIVHWLIFEYWKW